MCRLRRKMIPPATHSGVLYETLRLVILSRGERASFAKYTFFFSFPPTNNLLRYLFGIRNPMPNVSSSSSSLALSAQTDAKRQNHRQNRSRPSGRGNARPNRIKQPPFPHLSGPFCEKAVGVGDVPPQLPLVCLEKGAKAVCGFLRVDLRTTPSSNTVKTCTVIDLHTTELEKQSSLRFLKADLRNQADNVGRHSKTCAHTQK